MQTATEGLSTVDWWRLPEWFSVWSALIGAVVGGLLSTLTSWWLSGRTFRQQQMSLAFSASIKASTIHSDYVSTLGAINERIAAADAAGHSSAPLWTKVIPLTGVRDANPITPDELAVLFAAKEFDLVGDLIEVSMQHAAFVDAVRTYSELRFELKNHMPMSSTSGNIVTSMLSREDMARLSPRFLELDSLLTSILELGPKSRDASASALERIGPAARRYFRTKKFPLLKAAGTAS